MHTRGDPVEGRQVARCRDVAKRGGGGATQRHSLSTCHPDYHLITVYERCVRLFMRNRHRHLEPKYAEAGFTTLQIYPLLSPAMAMSLKVRPSPS